MAVKTFASIDIGSYELELKIFEISPKSGIREIDDIRHRLDLGKDTFRIGHISAELLDELCDVLRDFMKIISGYHGVIRVIDHESRPSSVDFVNMLSFNIVDFCLVCIAGSRIMGSETGRLFECRVRKLLPAAFDNDVGAWHFLRVEPPVVSVGCFKRQFFVLNVVLSDENVIAVTGAVMKRSALLITVSGG